MTDSSSTGYIGPIDTGPLEDDALDDFLQATVAGMTGLPGKMVRPRWQEEPPTIPARNENWAAIGVMRRPEVDTYPVEGHDSTGEGSDYLIRHESLELLCTFYGPNAQANGARLRDGLAIAQNREALGLAGMALISTGELTRSPELVKQRWLNRADLPVTIRREIRRTYPVLNIRSAEIELRSETLTDTVTVSPPS